MAVLQVQSGMRITPFSPSGERAAAGEEEPRSGSSDFWTGACCVALNPAAGAKETILKKPSPFHLGALFSGLLLASLACDLTGLARQSASTIPHEARWGIYSLDLTSQEVNLLYSSADEITNLDLNTAGDRFAFSQKVGGNDLRNLEIFTVGVDGLDVERLTANNYLDTYPAWSPDGSRIAYLSWPGSTMDLYTMQADGSHAALLYDSGDHDGDVDWVNGLIVFTQNSRIWIMNSDGSGTRRLTDPPRAGEKGDVDLPFGDYDPRLSPDGKQVVFERLIDDANAQGNYDLYKIDVDGSDLTPLTDNGYTQGLPAWAHTGDQIVYIISAVNGVAQYDAHAILPDGTGDRSVTPGYFPPQFLMHGAVFSKSDSALYFIGEWWN